MPPITATARALVRISLLRNGPQDLPYSGELLGLCVAASLGVGYLVLRGFRLSPTPGPDLLLTLVFSLAFVYGVLALRGMTNRFIQTATAFFGTDVIVSLVALPVLQLGTGAGSQSPVSGLAMIGITLWNIAIIGHILRHALSASFAFGILIALGYLFGSVMFTGLMHG